MKYPKNIDDRSTIGVPAPSAGVGESLDEFDLAVRMFTEQGFTIKESKSVRNTGIVSAEGKVRAGELMSLIEDESVDAIISATGGDFMEEILSYLDFNRLKALDKWFMGYSDNTNLTFPLTVLCDVATVYGPNVKGFAMNPLDESLEIALEILKGEDIKQESSKRYQRGHLTTDKGYQFNENTVYKILDDKPVDMTGRMIGGCLDVLRNLVGTPYGDVTNFLEKYKEDGFIWYFDIFALSAEDTYHALLQMKYAGWFKYLKGIVVGRVCFESTMMDMSYRDAFVRAFDDSVPIIMEADVGHVHPMMTIINGAVGHVVAENGAGYIELIRKV